MRKNYRFLNVSRIASFVGYCGHGSLKEKIIRRFAWQSLGYDLLTIWAYEEDCLTGYAGGAYIGE